MPETIKLRVAASQEPITLESASGSLAVEAVSPRVTLERVEGGTQMTVTDIDGTKTAMIPDGAQGPAGETGQDGVSPTVSVEALSSGHIVTITDRSGEHIFTVENGEDGLQGLPGRDGIDGAPGIPGAPGYSPVATVSKSGNTATITIKDKSGTTTATVSDGAQGAAGTDGYSPTVSVDSISGGHIVTITDRSGEHIFTVEDGEDGLQGLPGRDGADGAPGVPGAPGYSPVATVSKSGNTATITITDLTGTTTATVSDGTDAPNCYAPEFDATSGRAAGGYVVKDGSLYRAMCDISAGSFDAKKWISLNVGDELRALSRREITYHDSAPQTYTGTTYSVTRNGDEYTFSGYLASNDVSMKVLLAGHMNTATGNYPTSTDRATELVLKTGHIYEARLEYISGSVSQEAASSSTVRIGIYPQFIASGSINSIGTVYGGEGFEAYHYARVTFTADYTGGITPAIFIQRRGISDPERSNRLYFTDYKVRLTLCDITETLDGGMITETVSGTTPSITAQDGHRYMCGELASLSVTFPNHGIVDIVFSSGTTPTVLNVLSNIKWPEGFDPTDLKANVTYELNVMDGTYGAVGVWR